MIHRLFSVMLDQNYLNYPEGNFVCHRAPSGEKKKKKLILPVQASRFRLDNGLTWGPT